MRIEAANTIRVIGRSGIADTFRDIQNGAELPARIVERISGRDAVLEIAGKRIHAEFLKGLPAGSMIRLKLESIKDNSYLFKLVDTTGRESLAKQILDTTIFSMNDIQKRIMYIISGALANHPAGIFELNALLLPHQKQEKKDEGITRFLNLLLRLGINRNALADLSILVSGININAKAFQSILLLLGFGGDRIRKWTSGGNEDRERAISGLISDIEAIADDDVRKDVIRQLIALLKGTESDPAGQASGEFGYYDDEKFRPVRYFGREDSWIFSVEFSNIGRIDVLAREMPDGFNISIYSDSSEVVTTLRESGGQLLKNCSSLHPDIHINFYNTKQAINKIVEINSHYSLNSVLDIKA
ncbi:MAG: hypothetical protein A2176_12810 [Spirochaetes bacterium RBG_13_51_14]|nr:MAG: hypothetical protein A2176_12810 [Spirochaetes bacterium RBG_13_51_14]